MNTPSTEFQAIEAATWFRYLPTDARVRLAEQARLKSFDAGQYIVAKGEVGAHVYGLISGRLCVSAVTPRGRDVAIANLDTGEWFGAYSILGEDGAATDIIATEATTVLSIPIALIRTVGEQWPKLYMGLFEDQLLRSRRMLGLVELLGAHDLASRLAIRLLIMVDEQDKRHPGDPSALHLHINQSELASLCFGARQTVNRILAGWSEEGLLTVGAQGLDILDVNGLIRKAKQTGMIPEAAVPQPGSRPPAI